MDNPNLQLVTEAVVRASISEGTKILTDVTRVAWSKFRGLLAPWIGPESAQIEGRIDDVIAEPADEQEAGGLTKKLRRIEAPIPPELLAAATELVKLLDADEKTLETKQIFTQSMGNLSAGAVGIQAGHGASINVNQKKTKR